MEMLQQILYFLIHIDAYIIKFIDIYGTWSYIVLFAIIFCETGLVVFPFLPGDSLLFAAGSIAAKSDVLDIKVLFILLTIAAILGNKVNYLIGRAIGPRVFHENQSRWLNKAYLLQAHEFYERHGGKTIIIARFLPIIRTFAPFVAGIGYMSIKRFTLYNIMSAILWIGSMLFSGYFLGSIPFIQDNFSLVIYGVIAVTLLPPLLVFLHHRFFPK